MIHAYPGRVFFAVAYLVLALVFVTAHFTHLEGFETTAGGMAIKVRSSLGSRLIPSRIRRMSLSARGLEMFFRNRDRAVIVTEDGIRRNLDIVGWEAGEDSLRVSLSSGAAINFETSPSDGALRIVPEIPAAVPPIRSMELPFRAGGDAEIAENANRPGILSISSAGGNYIARLPAEASWHADSGRLDLRIQGEDVPVLEVSLDTRDEPVNALQWMERGTAPSAGDYAGEIERWRTALRRGRPARLDKVGADSEWSDALAAAILADAAERGGLGNSIARAAAAAARTPGRIGWLPSPYLGNIVNQFQGRLNEMNRTAALLRSGISRGNPDFSVDSALTVMVDTGYRGDAEIMVRSAGDTSKTPMSHGDTLARLRILQEARELGIGSRAASRRAGERLIDEYVLPSVHWIDEGLILLNADGGADLNQSIEAGALMVREHQLTGSTVYGAVGRQMVISGLGYADAQGMLPASLNFEAGGEVRREGSSAPESIYPLIADPRAYPRHLSLADELGDGAWALTAAENFTLRAAGEETVITMDFPVGSSHHLAISGIRSFETLIMRGVEWNPDPIFQQYHSGWNYDAARETLYIKIRHRTRGETIRILHTDPAAEAGPEIQAPGQPEPEIEPETAENAETAPSE